MCPPLVFGAQKKPGLDRVNLQAAVAGVCGNALNWFRNFLLDRRQQTIIGQSVSALEYLHAGVPQEAILSPLLFSLYMNVVTT